MKNQIDKLKNEVSYLADELGYVVENMQYNPVLEAYLRQLQVNLMILGSTYSPKKGKKK